MNFVKTSKGVWESDKQSYSAVMLAGEDRHPIGILEARFIIREGDYKNTTVYRLYEQQIGRKAFMKRFKTLESAIKFANEYVEE